MSQSWGPKIQERYMQILLDEDQDAFIFKFYHDGSFAALPRQSPIGMQVIMNAAEIVCFCSVRMKGLNV